MNENLLDIFDITFDFFSKKLPQIFIEKCDVDEVVLETVDAQESAENYVNVLKFIKLIKEKQPQLYKKLFMYFDDFMIDYFCFCDDKKMVGSAFSNFIIDPLKDYDKLLCSYKKILCYQHTDLIKKFIAKNYKKVLESPEIIQGAESELGVTMLYLTLEEFYDSDNSNFNKNDFIKKMTPYHFDLSDDFLTAFENGLYKDVLDEKLIKENFKNDFSNFLFTLQGYFMKYMKNKNFSFALSGYLWDQMLPFWAQNNKKKIKSPDHSFKVKKNDFDQFFGGFLSDIFTDRRTEMISVLWGSVYIYDFFYSIGIISQKNYYEFLKISNSFKKTTINNFHTLWKAGFVHTWNKADSVDNNTFIQEKKEFLKHAPNKNIIF